MIKEKKKLNKEFDIISIIKNVRRSKILLKDKAYDGNGNINI